MRTTKGENDQGWIKAYRTLKTHWTADDHRAFHLWIYLLLEVNHKEGKTTVDGSFVRIMPGQTLTSYDKMSRETHMTWRVVKNIISAFLDDGMIELKAIGRGLLLTVCNFEMYQGNSARGTSKTQSKTQSNDRPDDREERRVKRRQYKNIENIDNDNNNNKRNKDSAKRRVNLWEGAPEE